MAEASRSYDLKNIDWDDVAVFLALARFRTLSAAANSLGVTHATVGRRLRTLEARLGQKLFERLANGFELSDAGLQMLPDAESIESHVANIIHRSASGDVSNEGLVRLASMEAIASLYLAPKLSEFCRTNPAISIELVTAAHWINLSKREADVLISFPKPEGRRIQVERIGEFRLHLYGSTGYLAEHGPILDRSELRKHRFVDYVDELVEINAVRWLADVEQNANITFRSTSLIAQSRAVQAGIGIGLLPSFVAAGLSGIERILPETVYTSRPIWLTVHEDLSHLSRVKALVHFLKNLIARDQEFLNS